MRVYRDTKTGRFTSAAKWKREQSRLSDLSSTGKKRKQRYKREVIEGETITIEVSRPREGEYHVTHHEPQVEVVRARPRAKRRRKGKNRKVSNRAGVGVSGRKAAHKYARKGTGR